MNSSSSASKSRRRQWRSIGSAGRILRTDLARFHPQPGTRPRCSRDLCGAFEPSSRCVNPGVQAFRLWFSWLVSVWLYRSGRRHATWQSERYDSILVPIILSRDMVDQSRACERSPPSSRLPSPDHLFDTELPIDMGMPDVRLKTPLTTGCPPSPNLLPISQEAGRVRSTDISEQAAA